MDQMNVGGAGLNTFFFVNSYVVVEIRIRKKLNRHLAWYFMAINA